LAVRDPTNGQPLRAAGASGGQVAALDATFSAPKSVSVIWALSNPGLRAKIEAAHEQAISRAIQYAVQRVPMVRRRVDQSTVVHAVAKDIVATGWRHTTARAAGDLPPDPQLHTHVLLHAAVREDGRLVAIDSRTWLLHRRELGAAYRTELAHSLHQLGFEIERGTGRGGRYFEIHGVPQQLIDRFSSRHHQVRDEINRRLAAFGRQTPSAAEDRLAAISTRKGKQLATLADLNRAWRNTAAEVGFRSRDLERLQTVTGPQLEPAGRRQLLDALTEFDATFRDRDACSVALEQSAGAPIEQALSSLRAAREQNAVLDLVDGQHTTAWHRASERLALSSFTALTNNTQPPIDPQHVQTAREQVDRQLQQRGGKLSAEQRTALQLACSERQVVMIEGQAGTGKSTLLQAVALAHQADGRQILVTSTAALAAQRLALDLAEAGVSATPYSTVALQRAMAGGQVRLDDRSTVIHDEAALASTREQSTLFQAAEESGARLIIVGDPKQSPPVGAGGLWKRLENRARETDASVELTVNLRAQDPADRRDQKLFRDGQHTEALHDYLQRGRLHLHSNQPTAEQAALEAAHRDRRQGKRTIVIAQTSNEHLDELNAQAQALRSRDGELGEQAVDIPGRPYQLHPSDRVQIRRTLQHPEGPLRNGTTATIDRITDDGNLNLELADDSHRQLDRQQLQAADTRLAYVQHPFPAQGTTNDHRHGASHRRAAHDARRHLRRAHPRSRTNAHPRQPRHPRRRPGPGTDRPARRAPQPRRAGRAIHRRPAQGPARSHHRTRHQTHRRHPRI
jgi:conjugative relaxase-like TrwC/TraI family protein